MRNKINNRVLVGIAIVSAFLLLVVALLASYYLGPNQTPAWFQFFVTYHVEFMVAIAFSGILVGISVAYLAFEKVEEKTVESKINAEMMLGFLSSEEKTAVNYLLENNGKAFQHELSRIPGMSRLKAHRVVNKLVAKQIIAVEKFGKANKLKLAEQISDALMQE